MKTTFFSISNFNRKIKAQVIEAVNSFFLSKYITPNKIPFSILKWQNKRFTLEDKKFFHLLSLTENIEYSELLLDSDEVLLGVYSFFSIWKMSELITPKKGTLL